MMKNNYPIKYAVMALEEYKGDEVDVKDIDKNFDIYAYIVSECYLIGERIIYLPDGDNRHKYEIVYSFNPETDEEVYPKYSNNGICYNSVLVDMVYEDLELAMMHSRMKNEKLKIYELNNNGYMDINKASLMIDEMYLSAYKKEAMQLSRKLKK